MLKLIGKALFALALLFIGYLFWQAGKSAKVDDDRQRQELVSEAAVKPLQRIAFGSCNRQDKPQGYWEVIASHQPNQWLWLGDNVYADHEDPALIQEEYQKQLSAPEYQTFVKKVPVYGIYDDHDYGVNDGGKDWAIRAEASNMMLDFLNVPENHAARQREGGYQSYTLAYGSNQVRLILLDTRYFRDGLQLNKAKDQRYHKNEEGDILGEAQWQWLEGILASDSSEATIIVSSIQVLTDEHAYEKWSLFPKAKSRLLGLLNQYKPQNLLLLSGDRHLAEAAHAYIGETEKNVFGLNEVANTSGFEVLEITSSGLTHSYESADEANRFRVSPLIGQRNFGLLTIDWSDTKDPLLLIQVLSAKDDQEFFRVAMRGGKLLEDATSYNFSNSNMKTALKPCPESPNCVSTQTSQPKKKMDALNYSGSLADAKKALRDMVDGLPRTKLLEETDNYLHFSFTTLPIPFVDDVEFLFDDATKQIHFRSASRVGYSDLGANSRRMKKVSRRWAALQGN